MGIADYITCLLRNLYAGQEATIRTAHGTTGSKQGKEYDKALHCHPDYLTSVHSTSFKILGWMNHKLELRLLEKISVSLNISSVQFSSVAQSCLTLCNPMNHSTPRPPCPSPTPGVYSDSMQRNRGKHIFMKPIMPLGI